MCGNKFLPRDVRQQVDLTYAGQPYRLMVYAIGAWRYRVHLGTRVVAAMCPARNQPRI